MPPVKPHLRKRARRRFAPPEIESLKKADPLVARERVVAALAAEGGTFARAAKRLGVARSVLVLLVDRMGLRSLAAELKARSRGRFRLADGIREK